MSDLMSQSYHDVMEVYKRPMSVRYIPTIFWAFVSVISLSFAFPAMAHANHLPVMYVQVPQWTDDWAVCAVDIPDAKCHWYVMAPEGYIREKDSTGRQHLGSMQNYCLNDVAPMQASTVLDELQK